MHVVFTLFIDCLNNLPNKAFAIFILEYSGAAIRMTLTCNEGHTEEWNSSQTIKSGRLTVPLINLAILCYTFFSGLHWDQLKVGFRIKIKSNTLYCTRPFLINSGSFLCLQVHSTDISTSWSTPAHTSFGYRTRLPLSTTCW